MGAYMVMGTYKVLYSIFFLSNALKILTKAKNLYSVIIRICCCFSGKQSVFQVNQHDVVVCICAEMWACSYRVYSLSEMLYTLPLASLLTNFRI